MPLRAGEQSLCRLEEIPDGKARGFLPDKRRNDRLFAIRRGDAVYVYLNLCPHNWIGLDYAQDKFLSGDGQKIVCYAHGAHFAIETGVCTAGVCLGDRLRPVPHRVEDGELIVAYLPPDQTEG